MPRLLCLSEELVRAVNADSAWVPVVTAPFAVPVAATTTGSCAPKESSLLSIRLKCRLASLNIINVADHNIDHADEIPIAKPTAGSELRHFLIVYIEKYVIYAKIGYFKKVATLSALLGIIKYVMSNSPPKDA